MFLLGIAIQSLLLRRVAASVIPSDAKWAELNQTVGGRLYTSLPLAASCFSTVNGSPSTPNATECALVQQGYTQPDFRSTHYSAHMMVTSLASDDKCGLIRCSCSRNGKPASQPFNDVC